jgi:hypothetical protein
MTKPNYQLTKPKKPMNSFFRFVKSESKIIKLLKPGLTNIQISKEAADKWHRMTDLQKEPYRKASDIEFEIYKKDVDWYKKIQKLSGSVQDLKDSMDSNKRKKDNNFMDSCMQPADLYSLNYTLNEPKSEPFKYNQIMGKPQSKKQKLIRNKLKLEIGDCYLDDTLRLISADAKAFRSGWTPKTPQIPAYLW